jgi:hypothetical protein
MAGKRPQLHITVDRELFEVVVAEAEKNFESVSAVAEGWLRRVANGGAPMPVAQSPMAATKERSAAADLEMKEFKLAQLRKELLTVDGAVQVVEETLGAMRTEGLQLMADIAADHGLDVKELRRRFLEAMAGPGAVEREPLQRAADDFSKSPL